jgi:hypothetical protein
MAEKDETKKEPEAQRFVDPEDTAWKGSASSKKPLVGPDGHVHLSQEDIDARDS